MKRLTIKRRPPMKRLTMNDVHAMNMTELALKKRGSGQ